MKIKFIGTANERLWLAEQLRGCIRRSRPKEPLTHPKSGLYTVYYEVKTPGTNGENPHNSTKNA